MARKSSVYVLLIILAVFVVSGCSTVPKKVKEEVSGIRSKVDTLESRVDSVESKQAEVDRITIQQIQAIEELRAERVKKSYKLETNISTKSKKSKSKSAVKDIQVCLANAGFYTGKIDGIKGRNTKKAIKEFQRANGLKVDGVVGAKTLDALSKYAEGSGAGAIEQGATK